MGILWRFELLGRLRAQRSERVIDRFQTQKTAVLLAFLAYMPGDHSREALIDMLWPNADLAAGRDRLTQALVWLRPRLETAGVLRGSILQTTRASVGLNPQHIITDVAEFEAALAAARHAETIAAKKEALSQAIGLYRDELLPGFYEDWVLSERQRLLHAYLLALRHIIDLHLQEGETDRALEYARRALAADPLHEEAQYDVIRVLAASGQAAAALRQFEEMKRLWQKELDALPSPEVLRLVDGIRQTATFAPVPSAKPVPTFGLPAPLTRFFGREAEIERIGRYLQSKDLRLVTILGAGGSGKTRLALEAARNFVESSPRTVAFVPLADLSQAELIPAAISDALRLPQSPLSALERVVHALTLGPCLLVLDNMEHLMPDGSALVSELLLRVPSLQVLVASRQRLGIEGEQEISVPPLRLPDSTSTPEQLMQVDSVRLFVDRARSVYPDFSVTPDNATAVARVCERLEGIPLAIELCAAWARTLTPSQMQESLAHRFDLLISHRRDIAARHRTLRAALEYSYTQLPPNLQRFFVRLSVFRGGWSLEAAAAICLSDTPDRMATLAAITELRERSMVNVEEVGTVMRYTMLESLREFAGDQILPAESALCRKRHATFFLSLAEEAEKGMAGPEQDRSLVRLDNDQENLRAALAWCLEAQEITLGLRLGSALRSYWYTRGRLREGSEWLHTLLEFAARANLPSQPPALILAKVWNAHGHLAWSQADYSIALHAHSEALRLRRYAGDDIGVAESLYHLGITAYRQDDYALAQTYLDESLSLAYAHNDPASIARVLLNLGNIAYEQQRPDEARSLFQQSLLLERTLGNRLRVANALNNLGLIALEDKDYPHASSLFQECLTIHRDLSDDYGASIVLANLGTAVRLLQQRERARSLLTTGLKMAYELGNKHILVHYLLQLGILASAEKEYPRSVLLLSAAQHRIERTGGSRQIAHAEGYTQAQTTNQAALGETKWDALWAHGRTLEFAQIVSFALSPPNESGDLLQNTVSYPPLDPRNFETR